MLHPDLRGPGGYVSTETASDEEMRLLLKAYEVLSNPAKRRDYDALITYFKPVFRRTFDYRQFLKERREDLFSQAKLIFYDLLNARSTDALELYQDLCATRNFRLEKYLTREDYMDCAFLLAEQFAKRKQYVEAMELFKKIYLDEIAQPYFKHFLEEIVVRMKQIACAHLDSVLPPQQNLRYLEELIGLDFSNKDKALFYKKMAEIYLDLGDTAGAIDALARGLAYNKRLSGVKKLKEKIGFPEIGVPR